MDEIQGLCVHRVGLVAEAYYHFLVGQAPEVPEILKKYEHVKGQMLPYQYALLYLLAKQYNFDGATILDIGVLHGKSMLIMGEAAPRADIFGVNPNGEECTVARKYLNQFEHERANVFKASSLEWRTMFPDLDYDFILVDGDHKNVRNDLPYWNRLKPMGLMLFHDYSEKQCPPVYDAVNWMAQKRISYPPDVEMVDKEGIGIAGFYFRTDDLTLSQEIALLG